jgi:hypothetical protein
MANFIKPNQQLLQNQAKLILQGHGLALLKPKLFVPNVRRMADEGSVFEVGGADTYDKKSLFGTPIFDIVTIQCPAYTDENGKNIPAETLDLDFVLMEVSKPRNIVKTVVAGRPGSVKEYMSDGDYQISMKGMFTNPLAYSAPSAAVQQFDRMTKTPLEMKVNSNFLNFFEIYNIVVEDSKCRQREGARNVIDFELSCISDTPFEIRSQNENQI